MNKTTKVTARPFVCQKHPIMPFDGCKPGFCAYYDPAAKDTCSHHPGQAQSVHGCTAGGCPSNHPTSE